MNRTRAGNKCWMAVALLTACWCGARGAETPEALKNASGLRFEESSTSHSADADAAPVEGRSNPRPFAAALRLAYPAPTGRKLSSVEPPEPVRQTPQLMDADGGLKGLLQRAAARAYAGAVAADSWASGFAGRFAAAVKEQFAPRPAAIPPSSLGPDVW